MEWEARRGSDHPVRNLMSVPSVRPFYTLTWSFHSTSQVDKGGGGTLKPEDDTFGSHGLDSSDEGSTTHQFKVGIAPKGFKSSLPKIGARIFYAIF